MNVVVLGPTGSGKSDVAMAVATAIGSTEILAVDAMQVYRRMDIGTAKPTVDDRARVPHHGLDLVDPSESYAVAEFQRAARTALEGIAARGARALLVAGTGLYLTAVIDDLEIPGSWPTIRAELDAEPETAVLLARLSDLDPVAVARLEPSNRRRIVRALEVCLGSGRAFSSYGPGIDAYPAIPFVQIGLRWERQALAARIEQRVHRMMAAGLLDEVATLHRERALSRTAAQALGYKELIDHLEGRCQLSEAVDTIITRTRQFAVRQDRWFRRDPRIRWISVQHDPMEAFDMVREAVCA